LHIGIHNLSVESAVSRIRVLNEYTRKPSLCGPAAILEWVASHRATLVIPNHPLWDETGVGQDVQNAIRKFRGACAVFTHALELNGLHRYSENLHVTGLARAWSKPVISGGDRHTFEANTVLNLTNADCFSEFAAEVRSGHSSVILLPSYQQPLSLRMMRMVCDVLCCNQIIREDGSAGRTECSTSCQASILGP
jgi:hypothetical protein